MKKLESMVLYGVMAIVNFNTSEHVTGELKTAADIAGVMMLIAFFCTTFFGKSDGKNKL